MSQLLKCPNPSCSFIFDAAGLPPGAVLICPRCTMRFTLGPLPPTSAAGRTATSGEVASPGNDTSPLATAGIPSPTPYASSALPTETPWTAVEPSVDRPIHASNRLKSAAVALIVVAALGLAGYAVWYNMHLPVEHSPAAKAVHYRDLNISFASPGEPWTTADDLRAQIGAPVLAAFQYSDQTATVLLAARNYDKREPRNDELQETLLKLLRRIVDLNSLTRMPPDEQEWMGLQLGGFRFRAQSRDEQTILSGQAYYASHKGVAYWFVGWTSESAYEQMKPEFARVRSHCQLLNLREQWRPTLPPAAPYKNTQIGYAFYDPSGVWKEETDEEVVKARDPQADKSLTLKLYAQGQHRDLAKEGFLLVYVLPGGEEPLQVARHYVEKSRQEELQRANADLKVEFQERTEPPEGELPASGLESGVSVLRLRSTVKNALQQNRLHVLAAIKVRDGRVVALHGWCDWNDRFAVEPHLIQVVSTLRSLEGGGN